MSIDLERELRIAAKNGFLFLSMAKDWQKDEWIVNYRTTDSTQYQSVRDADLVVAMSKALRAGTRDSKEQMKDKPAPRRRDTEDLL